MSVRIEELRGPILGIVVGIILIVVGYVAGNVMHSIGTYIVTTVNQQISGTSTVSPAYLIQPSQVTIAGLALMMAGISLLIASVALIIKLILGAVSDIKVT